MKKWVIAGLGFLVIYILLFLYIEVLLGIDLIIVTVGLGGLAYILSGRKIKPFTGFLAKYGNILSSLWLSEAYLRYYYPNFHLTMQNITANLIGGILRLGGVQTSISGSTITLENPSIAFDIHAGCLPGLPLCIYIALVLAEFKANPKQRLTGILLGLPLLLGLNILRITLSIYLEWLTGVPIHDLLSLLNICLVPLLIWVVWLKTSPYREELIQSIKTQNLLTYTCQIELSNLPVKLGPLPL